MTTPAGAAVPEPATASAPAQTDKQDYSPAERLLFMSPQLGRVKPPQTLRYSFRKAGSFEPGFDDKVAVAFTAAPDGSCCAARSEFLSGERRLNLPEVPTAEGNPVILYFLEHDVREMQRLTKGSQNHFRQRIRMAVYQGAALRELSVRWRGQAVKATEISFSPFLDDPNRPKYEKFVRKQYRFVLSEAVPGGVYAIRTEIPSGASSDTQAAPLIVEELQAEGAEL
ncbi:MAG TPA: hypothetical protein VJ693_23260 [Ideonella sp.]|nr:hypothetical protein [Ideonella sp.]